MRKSRQAREEQQERGRSEKGKQKMVEQSSREEGGDVGMKRRDGRFRKRR